MIYYIVNVRIDESIELDWVEWMQTQHIPDVMATELFESAELLRDADDKLLFKVKYACSSRERLDNYLANHTERLRKDHNDRYEGKFAASREILEEIARF
jgi:hypothetical protein